MGREGRLDWQMLLDYTTMNRFWNHVLAAPWPLLVSLAPLLGQPSVADADQTDPRLPALFDRLQQTDNPAVARLTEFMIWQIWGESGKGDLDRLMREGEEAMGAADFKTAKARFDAVIAARPDFAEAWNKRATMHYFAGDYQASLDDIEQVLELEPRHFGALSGLGLVNIALSRDAAALDAFERVLALYPTNLPAQQNLSIMRKRIQEGDI